MCSGQLVAHMDGEPPSRQLWISIRPPTFINRRYKVFKASKLFAIHYHILVWRRPHRLSPLIISPSFPCLFEFRDTVMKGTIHTNVISVKQTEQQTETKKAEFESGEVFISSLDLHKSFST